MNDWRINAKCITKYNPALRDNDGRYTIDDWTSYQDIGTEFNGKRLEQSTYLEVEARYIQAVMMFCEVLNCNMLIIGELEKYSEKGLTADELAFYNSLINGQEIGLKNLERLVQLILREFLWCELICSSNSNNSIHFGYDYYMYFSSHGLEQEFWDKIEKLGLFVE